MNLTNFAGSTVGSTEHEVDQQWIDDTRSLSTPIQITNVNWAIAQGVLRFTTPQTTALQRYVTGYQNRHAREPLEFRTGWAGQPVTSFPVISIVVAAGVVVVDLRVSSTVVHVNQDIEGSFFGIDGTVARRILDEDLKTATVVVNCDSNGDTRVADKTHCRFRLLENDRCVSSEPISDSLQYFKAAALTSNYGFTFKPETTNLNHAAPILESFSLIH